MTTLRGPAGLPEHRRRELDRQYVELGLYQGQELLVLDLAKCTRCDECVRACADSHGGITRVVRDGPRFGHLLVAISCRSCHEPACVTECPVNAIHREGTALEIQIDGRCIGCSLCAHNCPFGSIHMVEEGPDGVREVPPHPLPDARERAARQADGGGRARLRAVNCDLCNDSPGTGPRCVYACPHDAAHRMTGPEILDEARAYESPRAGFWRRFVEALRPG
jgi:Fe-S-cluster-containing hydrogenase component 2